MSLKNMKKIEAPQATKAMLSLDERMTKISRAVSAIDAEKAITEIIYKSGVEEKSEMADISFSVNYLINMVAEKLTHEVLGNIENPSDDEVEFTRGLLSSAANYIAKSAWEGAKGDPALAETYCESGVYLVSEAASNAKWASLEKLDFDLPKNIEQHTMKANILIPCIATVIEIKAIRDDEIRNAILGGMTIEDLVNRIADSTIKSCDKYVSNLLNTLEETEDSMGSAHFSRLSRKTTEQVKSLFSMVFEKELRAMKESGMYEPIYDRAMDELSFFLPITFSYATPIQTVEASVIETPAPIAETQAVIVETPAPIIEAPVVVEVPVVVEAPIVETPVVVEAQAVEVQAVIVEKKIEAPVVEKPVQVEVVESKPLKVESPIKQVEDELPIYTSEELAGKPILERYQLIAKIKRGEAILIDGQEQSGGLSR